MAVNDNKNFRFNFTVQYKRNSTLSAKRKGTTKLSTEMAEKNRNGTYEINPANNNRNAIKILIA